jgi:predicted AAA+ superfamily ATPase
MDVREISFPVGRVEYLAMRPCSFLEFLNGTGNDFDAELVRNLEATPVHERVIKLFNQYTLIGGMPAIVSKYAENQDILSLKRVYNSLLQSYRDDIEKYTQNANVIKTIRVILDSGWLSAGSIITFEKFGGSNFSSKEMSLAFQTIQKAMLLELVFPVSNTQMPLMPNHRQRPKLIWLDTGLVNFMADMQVELFSVKDIHDAWRGRIAEQIVAQELLTLDDNLSAKRYFWKRDKHGSEAEVDFLYKYRGLAIPIEVKSGHNSKLTSLHLYMDETPHSYAVRVWSNPFSVDTVTSPGGKPFTLINLPYYYTGMIDKVLDSIL